MVGTIDDVQVSVVEPEAAPTFVHITDPRCRNLNFGSGPRESWIILRANIPANYPDDTPDSILDAIPGEAFFDLNPPDDPGGVLAAQRRDTLKDFRASHGRHAKIEETTVAEPKPKKK